MLECAAETKPDACRYMRIIEEWGSGIPRIQKMPADAGLKFRIWRPTTSSTDRNNALTREKTAREKAAKEKTAREKTTEKMVSGAATTEKTTEKTMGNTATIILRIIRDSPSPCVVVVVSRNYYAFTMTPSLGKTIPMVNLFANQHTSGLWRCGVPLRSARP